VKLALARDEAGGTPLHLAAGNGRIEVVSFLISRGADVNAADNNARPRSTPRCGRPDEVVGLLIRAEGRSGCPYFGGRDSPRGGAGRGAARAAARLLQAGAATEAANAYRAHALLLVARESGKADIARLLVGRKANVDAKDKSGDTPLTLAAWRGFRGVVELLLQSGATVPGDGPVSQSLRQSAAAKGLDALFMKLAGMGVDPRGAHRTRRHAAARRRGWRLGGRRRRTARTEVPRE